LLAIVFGDEALVGFFGSMALKYCGPRFVRISFFCARPSRLRSFHLYAMYV
jgi:hypothetical protein